MKPLLAFFMFWASAAHAEITTFSCEGLAVGGSVVNLKLEMKSDVSTDKPLPMHFEMPSGNKVFGAARFVGKGRYEFEVRGYPSFTGVLQQRQNGFLMESDILTAVFNCK